MGRYTNIELEEMKKTEPERAFYFSHEDEFMQMGIDLTLDGWDSVLQTSMVPSPDENRYAFFMRSLRDGGITVLDDKNNLRKLQYDDTKKDPLVVTELKDSNEKIRSYTGDRPQEPKRPERPHLGFGTRLLQLITIGIYRPKALKEYDNNMQKFGKDLKSYEKAMENYKEAEEAFRNEEEKRCRAKTYALKEYEKTLDERGKTQEMRNDYRKALEAHAEEYGKIKGEKESLETLFRKRDLGRERLDLVFGPNMTSDNANEMIDRCDKASVIDKESLKAIKTFDMPEKCPFNEHEIALLGYCATCNSAVNVKAAMQPDPNKPPVKNEMSENEKIHKDGLWYNFIDGIITRIPREAANAVPLINYAKTDAMNAIEKYMNGDSKDLGKIICDGIRRSVAQTVMPEFIKDDSSFPDYGHICGELLQLMDKNKKLYDAAIEAGLTQEYIKAAKVSANIAKVCDKGLTAQHDLTSMKDLTYEQKLSATADVAAMRLTQKMMAKRHSDITASPEYQKRFEEVGMASVAAQNELKQANKARKKAEEEKAPNLAELENTCKLKKDAHKWANAALYTLSMGYVLEKFGVNIMPDQQMQTLSLDNSPQGLHDMYVKNDTFQKLAKQPSSQLFQEMAQTNADKYLKAVQDANKPVDEQRPSVEKAANKTNDKAAQRQNVLG